MGHTTEAEISGIPDRNTEVSSNEGTGGTMHFLAFFDRISVQAPELPAHSKCPTGGDIMDTD